METTRDREVTTRRISLADTFAGLPKHFAGEGDLIQSHFIAAMSAVFPDGEDYFVKSVRHYRDQVTDPVLRRQVAGFIGQEATHGREHRLLNDRLDQVGYAVKLVERINKRALALQFRLMSPETNLANTAAIEHVTATLAELMLTDEAFRKSFGSTEGIFTWHALEEAEHKAVAFDVYRAVGGSERRRIIVMRQLRWGLLVGLPIQIIISLLRDRATYRPGTLRQSWRRFRTSALVSKATWNRLKDYERPDFHPNDWDNTELVDEWRQRLFGADGELRANLISPAA